jgi:hypothetical protein
LGKKSTKYALNPKQKFKYKIGIRHDGKRNSALKLKKIMPEIFMKCPISSLHLHELFMNVS